MVYYSQQQTLNYELVHKITAVFIKRCLYSDSPVVKHVAHHGVFMVVWHPALVVISSHVANVMTF